LCLGLSAYRQRQLRASARNQRRLANDDQAGGRYRRLRSARSRLEPGPDLGRASFCLALVPRLWRRRCHFTRARPRTPVAGGCQVDTDRLGWSFADNAWAPVRMIGVTTNVNVLAHENRKEGATSHQALRAMTLGATPFTGTNESWIEKFLFRTHRRLTLLP